MKKIKIAIPLSDLVIYTKSQKFVSFEHSLINQKCYENNSIGETRARRFVKHAGNFFWFNEVKVTMLLCFTS